MPGYTSPDGLPFPNQYSDPADVPATVQALANATQTALNNHVDKVVQVVAGTGLTGGGALSGSGIVLHVGQGEGTIVTENAVSIDPNYVKSVGDDRFARLTHGHAYADVGHGHNYAPAAHGHNPSASGISVIYHNFGSLAAGASKTARFGRSNDQYPTVSVSHPSTYILAVISTLIDGAFDVEVRNSTSSTPHSDVAVIIHLVRAA